jgi:methyl-accepting chemotaxis protein
MIASISAELLEIEAQLEEVNKGMQSVQERTEQEEALIQEILNAKEIYKSATVEQKKAILNLLINRIEVADTDEVDIFLNI